MTSRSLTPPQRAAFPALVGSIRLTRSAIFGDEHRARPKRATHAPIIEDDAIPTVGFVGPDYEAGGVCVLGINPGNSPSNGEPTDTDRRLYVALRRLRSEGSEEAFAALMDVARLETSQWPIVRRYCDMRLEEIVYTNVVPFRTEGGARGAYPFFAAGFERHLRPLMGAVKPALIVGLGVEIERRAPDWLREIGIVTIDRNRSLTTEQRNAQSARVRKAILGLQPG